MSPNDLHHRSESTAVCGTVGAAQQEDQDIANADQLWAALVSAQADDRPQARAHTEDAVFRFYLPLARNLAQSSPSYPQDPEGAEQAAELGLAQAVLAWRRPNGHGFDRTARTAISSQLQYLPRRMSTARREPAAGAGTGGPPLVGLDMPMS